MNPPNPYPGISPKAKRSPLRIVLIVAGSLVGLCVVLAITALLTFDWFVKRVITNEVRKSANLELQIGTLDIGLLRQRITLRDVKVFAEPQFGGVQVLDLPELHIEYDGAALSKREKELHLRLVRVRLNELALVDDLEEKPVNMMQLVSSWPEQMAAYTNRLASLTDAAALDKAQRVGRLKFSGVDRLELTVGKVRFVDLKDPAAERLANLNINKRVLTNLATLPDLVPLAVDLVVRSTLGAQPVKK